MNLASYVDSGAIVDIVIDSNGSRVMRYNILLSTFIDKQRL